MTGGFVKINRSITNWEWYTDIKTFKLFIHMVLTANFTDASFCGIPLSRGQLASSISHLSTETGLSQQEVRTAIQHLKKTGELTSIPQGKYTLFTVVNYNFYQSDSTDGNKASTDFQQGFNYASTDFQQQYKNNNNNKNDKKNEEGEEEERLSFGTYRNVYLTSEEYFALKRDYSDCDEKINRLSKYMADTNKTYASHYDTIVRWAQTDSPKKESPRQYDNWDPEEFFRIAVERSMGSMAR